MFSTRLSTIACTLSMLSRFSPSSLPCRADIWLLALRRLADILFNFTWGKKAESGSKENGSWHWLQSRWIIIGASQCEFRNGNGVCATIGSLPMRLWESTSLPLGSQFLSPYWLLSNADFPSMFTVAGIFPGGMVPVKTLQVFKHLVCLCSTWVHLTGQI